MGEALRRQEAENCTHNMIVSSALEEVPPVEAAEAVPKLRLPLKEDLQEFVSNSGWPYEETTPAICHSPWLHICSKRALILASSTDLSLR